MSTDKKGTGGRFRAKGKAILGDSNAPKNIGDFLDDDSVQMHKPTNPQDHNCGNVEEHKSTNLHEEPKKLARLHVYMHRELKERLRREVFERSQRGLSRKEGASERAVIEEALELFFQNRDF